MNFRSVYNPYDPFLATSLAQLQAAAIANAANNHGGSPGMTDPRLQVCSYHYPRTSIIPFDGAI